MDYFIFLELTPECLFPPFCGLGCGCMLFASPRVPFPFSFTYFPSSVSPTHHHSSHFTGFFSSDFGFHGDVEDEYCVKFWVYGDINSRVCLPDRVVRED